MDTLECTYIYMYIYIYTYTCMLLKKRGKAAVGLKRFVGDLGLGVWSLKIMVETSGLKVG